MTTSPIPPNHDAFQKVLRHRFGLFTEEEVAGLLKITTSTLDVWRAEKRGPTYVKSGRSVFYLERDIVDYLEGNRVVLAARRDDSD